MSEPAGPSTYSSSRDPPLVLLSALHAALQGACIVFVLYLHHRLAMVPRRLAAEQATMAATPKARELIRLRRLRLRCHGREYNEAASLSQGFLRRPAEKIRPFLRLPVTP